MTEQNPYGAAGVPPARSEGWKIWVGIVLAIPLLIATTGLAAVAGSIDGSGALSSVVGLAGLLTPIVLLFPQSTRKIAVGLLIGYAVLLLVGAGVCVALLASYN